MGERSLMARSVVEVSTSTMAWPAARQAPSAASCSPYRAAKGRGRCRLDYWRSASPSAVS